jgi:glucose-1-phosphate thymidylyltransferase
MKCIVLAGGKGTRMSSMTQGANKHLLMIDEKRTVIERSVDQLPSNADVCVVTTARDAQTMRDLLDVDHVVVQRHPDGIADAMNCAREWAKGEAVTLLLGDTLFDALPALEERKIGSMLFTAHHDSPTQFGCVTVDEKRFVVSIVEKPKVAPKACEVSTGLYSFDASIWTRLRFARRNRRGEFDLTHVLRTYIDERALCASLVTLHWNDLGTSPRVFSAEKQRARQRLN